MARLVQPDVTMEVEATPDEVTAVGEAFRTVGIEAAVRADYERKGVGTFPWAMFVEVPVGAFFTALAAEAGKDAYKSLKRLIGHLYEARRQSSAPRGTVLLKDPDVHEEILLEDGLPDQAWEQLIVKVDFRRTPSGQLRWDALRAEWRDAWDPDET